MKKIYKIEIDLNVGSKFQMEFAESSLRLMLNAWQDFCNQKHKNNKIGINTRNHE